MLSNLDRTVGRSALSGMRRDTVNREVHGIVRSSEYKLGAALPG
jgi:hypothetical protein